MSVFDLPRLHFSGTATTQLPTGLRTGLLDLARNAALTPVGQPFPADRPAHEYHQQLDQLELRTAPGAHFGGNGHFTVDATVTGVDPQPSEPDRVVGRSVDLWGHYNEYFATTANRARVFDIDPASSWTTTLMVGHFCFGRLGRSHDIGYLCSGEVTGWQPPRWQVFPPGRSAVPRLPLRSVHQFSVPAEALSWPSDEPSPTVARLRELTESGAAAGLVVQFALNLPPTPLPTGRPLSWQLDGTIAPWHSGELRSYPAGRLLTARPGPGPEPQPLTPAAPRQLCVAVDDQQVGVNLIAAPGGGAGRGHWELRTAGTDRLIAELPDPLPRTVLTVPRAPDPAGSPSPADPVEPLQLDWVAPDGTRLPALHEQEVNIQSDQAGLIMEHPRHPGDAEYDTGVTIRSLVRGRPAAVQGIRVEQHPNPWARPLDEGAAEPVVRLRSGGHEAADQAAEADWGDSCSLDTDSDGLARFTVRGAQAGCARLLFAPPDALGPPSPPGLPFPPDAPGSTDPRSPADALAPAERSPVGLAASAAERYDDPDIHGYWSGVGHAAVRVLPDDWRLAELPPEQLTFDLLYREVFAFYELTSSFMKEEVFSLADRARVETYARLVWQMCDPRNKTRTYYMPPTRDLTEPKARLLLAYLRKQQTPSALLTLDSARRRAPTHLTTRAQLVAALHEAVTLELAVTLQYLYAAYSLPTHGAGLAYQRHGAWSAERLRLISGDGGETLDHGIRSTLLRVAREEMTHFLVVNNVLTAIGEPFRFPAIDFGTVNRQSRIPLDLALEGLTPGSVQRFITLEQPDRTLPEPRYGRHTATGPARSDTLSGLYAAIREGLRHQPELFEKGTRRAGGEHHVFLRQAVNSAHPDYQLQVDDLSSALFAIDFVTEQGEGQETAPEQGGSGGSGEESHYDSFRRIAVLLDSLGPLDLDPSRHLVPALGYPVLRNPTRHTANGNQQQITDPTARELARLCDESYALTAQLMVQHFGEASTPSLRRSVLMNAAIDVMNGVLRPLAELLVTVPSGVPGRTAGPPFALTRAPAPVPAPLRARELLRRRTRRLRQAVRDCELIPEHVGGTLDYLDGLFGGGS
ncbi:ferritin-like domain-containing protein [Kitasatospora acidiphila]|uniref:ferritin-like domain-containing protein n=1 Tax=Kitasatospora acidiphila TaxID=2567942 RepID=UPI003C7466BA